MLFSPSVIKQAHKRSFAPSLHGLDACIRESERRREGDEGDGEGDGEGGREGAAKERDLMVAVTKEDSVSPMYQEVST